MLAFRTKDKNNSGIILKKKNIMTNFYEKVSSAPGNLANGAIYLINKNYLKKIKKKNYEDFSREIIMQNLNKVCIFETKKFYMDVGTLANLNYVKLKKNLV